MERFNRLRRLEENSTNLLQDQFNLNSLTLPLYLNYQMGTDFFFFFFQLAQTETKIKPKDILLRPPFSRKFCSKTFWEAMRSHIVSPIRPFRL